MSRRKLIIIIGLPIYTFALMIAGTFGLLGLLVDDFSDLAESPRAMVEALGDPGWWAYAGAGAVVIVGLQAIFLIPMFNRRPPREQRGKSLTVSLVLAGAIAGLLMMGLGAGAMELIRILTGARVGAEDPLWLVPLGALAVGWVFWTLLLLAYVRGIWADRTLGRIVGILFAGTVLEALLILPIDVMVRRRTDCYCNTGTFIALCVSVLGALWLTGPGVVIALMCGKHRRWRETYCEKCGHAKGPSPGTRCAECGYEWRGRGSC